MSKGIGKEHPYQQITDTKTAIKLALDEVMRINDTAPSDMRSKYDPCYLFGSWYMAFLDMRRNVMRQGQTFTREYGEVEIARFFSPERKRELAESEEAGRREFNRRVMEKRIETGCYTEDGLYERVFHEPSGTILLFFVDDSRVMNHPSKGTRVIRPVNMFATVPTLADEWLTAAGEGFEEMALAMRRIYTGGKTQ